MMKWICFFLCWPLIGWMSDADTLLTYTVKISNHSSKSGIIRLGVYDKSETFPDEKLQFRGLIESCKDETVVIRVLLPKGKKYAFAAYHDANNNAVLDKNMLGMPIERYGFSNGARGLFAPPSFEEATVLNNSKEVLIRLE